MVLSVFICVLLLFAVWDTSLSSTTKSSFMPEALRCKLNGNGTGNVNGDGGERERSGNGNGNRHGNEHGNGNERETIGFDNTPDKLSPHMQRASYLLGLLAMIKCSICSYQCDN